MIHAIRIAVLVAALTPAVASAQNWDPPQTEPVYRYATKTPRNCVDRAGFPAFLQQARVEAQRRGVGQRGLAALGGIEFDESVVSRDRGQKVFTQTFEEFSSRMVPPRLGPARKKMQQHAALLQRIEREYGVPAGVLVAIWGLETDYGAFLGTFPTVRAIATLAYDCRRPEKFRPELMAILKIVDQGNLDPATAKGA